LAPTLHPVVADVTARVTERSRASRTAYLERISRAASELSLRPARTDLGCSNLAHAAIVLGRPVPPEAEAPVTTPSPKAADDAADAATKIVPADEPKKEAKP